ncbi:MAG: cysteine hydrolase [Acidobacteriota bacterium]|nr:cysteine hydrolase [Acidobacteriota bacterium]
MPQSEDLHGNAPDKSNVALVLIDVIGDYEFEDGEKLFKNALPMSEKLAALKQKAKQAEIPVIYVNDNYGKWQSDFKKLLAHSLDKNVRGSKIAERLAPDEDDYFVLKPKHSGFYSTTLEILLEHLQSKTLILTGVATDICVLFTANDAYLRDYKLVVPGDCVAANDEETNRLTLKYIERVLKADTRPSTEINFSELSQTN